MAVKAMHNHQSHAQHFVSTLSANQRNSLRVLLVKNAAVELHRALDLQKAVTRAVNDAEHNLMLAREGRTSELFRDQHAHADIKVRL